MTAIVTATPLDLTHVRVTFDAAVDPSTMPPSAWAITPPAGAAPASVLAVAPAPGNIVVDLLVGAALSAGETYGFLVAGAFDALGVPIVGPGNQANGTAPMLDAPSAEWPHPYLDAITQALAEEAQLVAGHPTTQTIRDLPWDAADAYVVSTLGFAAAGAFFAGGRRYTYTAKTDMVLSGLVADHVDGTALPAGTEVHHDASAVEPA